MATTCTCSVPGCGITFEPGHGGRGGEEPLCGMHYQRSRRKSKRPDDPERIIGGRHALISVHCTPQLKKWIQKTAKREGYTVSEWITKVLTAAMEA